VEESDRTGATAYNQTEVSDLSQNPSLWSAFCDQGPSPTSFAVTPFHKKEPLGMIEKEVSGRKKTSSLQWYL
jgi:hypothetical protein